MQQRAGGLCPHGWCREAMTMVLQRPAALMLLLLVHVAAAVLATTEDLWPNMLGRAAIN